MLATGVVETVTETIEVLPSPLGDDPALVAGIVASVILLILLAVAIFWRSYRLPGRRFARTVGRNGAVGILMHPNPDPDAMSCALAAATIAESRDTNASIYYPGQIRHHENRALETLLESEFEIEVSFEQIDAAEDIAEDAVVLVDHNEARSFPNAEMIDPVAVVDHHPGDGTGQTFTDVRDEYGACATIFAEYIEELNWRVADPDEELEDKVILQPGIATALVYGILSDTSRLTSGVTGAEFEAMRFLSPGIDEDILDRIANPDMDAESLEIKARAITGRTVQSSFAISDVGKVSNLDAIPQAADELRQLEGISAVVVMGERDGTIRLAGRSSDDRVHMGKVLSAVADEIPMAEAGGHARMGGGTISIEHMEGLGPSDGMTRDEMKVRLFEAMGGDI